MKPTREHAIKIVELISHGLVKGLGKPIAGQLCVEAAVCLALGLPHGDNPPCVGDAVRSVKIKLNDSNWSSNEARALGMRKIAVAQLGSNSIDQGTFRLLLMLKIATRMIPDILQDLADTKLCLDKPAMLACAQEFQDAKNVTEVAEAVRMLDLDLARTLDLDLARAHANALARALAVALDHAHALARALDLARDLDLDRARALARALALARDLDLDLALDRALDRARARARARALALALAEDALLNKVADMILECLIELKSPGVEWIDVCEV